MKEIIVEKKADQVELDALVGNEIIVYRSWMGRDTDNYKFLAKLAGGKWGFVPMNSSDTNATFVDTSWGGAIEKAAVARKLYMFDDIQSLAKALKYGYIKGRKNEN